MEETKPLDNANKSEETHTNPQPAHNDDGYPSKKVMLPAMAALYLAVFLVSLDRTIIGTATPSITNEFHSFDDIAWYEAGFLLPWGVLQLSFGRVYTFYSSKWVLIALVAIFELGSIVSATAPSSNAFIVGRVISGIGSAGIQSGSMVLMTTLVPLESRPKYMGGIGALFGLASILGPLLGGYLTAITWRWCFWINLPIGGASLVALALLTPRGEAPVKSADTWTGRIDQLDPLGFILIAPAIVSLLFALQWGGVEYAWNDGRIIALFVVFGVLGVLFIGAQVWRQDKATVPPAIITQRTILWGSVASFGFGTLLIVYAYYLPIWFQAIQGKSPQESGLSLLGLLLSTVLFVVGGGLAITLVGYYTPFLTLGAIIAITGGALLSTLQVDATPGQWIGYQVIVGIGQGLMLQVPNIAAQTVLPNDQIPIGLTVINFIQTLGGTVFVTVCQTLLDNRLVAGLEGKIAGFDPSVVSNSGATSLRTLVPADQVPLLLEVYNDSIRAIWYVGLSMACLAFLASFGLEWESVKSNKKSEKASVDA